MLLSRHREISRQSSNNNGHTDTLAKSLKSAWNDMIGLTEKSPMESPKENVIVKSARKRDRECSN